LHPFASPGYRRLKIQPIYSHDQNGIFVPEQLFSCFFNKNQCSMKLIFSQESLLPKDPKTMQP